MSECLSKERKDAIRKQIAEERGGYKRAWNPRYNPAYDVAYIKAKELIACGYTRTAAWMRAGITPDAFRLRERWEREGNDQRT